MTTKQYELCEHRSPRPVAGVHLDYFDTPCPLCQAAEAYTAKATKVALVLLVSVVLAACGVATRCPQPYGCNAGKAGLASPAGKPTESNGGSLGGAKPGPAGNAGTNSPGSGNAGAGAPGAGSPGAGNPGGGKAPGKGASHGGHGKGGKGHGGKGGRK